MDLKEKYDAMLAAGDVKSDPDQRMLVERMARLNGELRTYPDVAGHAPGLSIRNWRIAQLLGLGGGRDRKPRGLYVWGGVGRGKSMLMDLMFESAPVKAKQRVHFHEFMLDVHARLDRWRHYTPSERAANGGRAGDSDPVAPTAHEIACEATLLCFDEFQVTDIADAMVLSRLFSALFERGVIVVATSNRPPDDLYKDGLNRQLFLPFIAALKEELDVVALNGDTDYRLDRLQGMPTYLTPVNSVTTRALSDAFFRLTNRDVSALDARNRPLVPSDTLTVQGRTLTVPKAMSGVAVFSFKKLCGSALGSADYLAVARKYHTVILVAVPQLGPENRNEAKRFVTLIDALYEYGVKFLCSAAVRPDALYGAGTGAFEFERTVSRLMEMQSEGYLARGHGRLDQA